MNTVYSSTIVKQRAYAKINLCLDALRKREDGYHDLRMVMQTVGVYDELTFEIGEDTAEQITLDFKELPENANLGPVEKNLIYRAARLLLDEFQIKASVIIALKKRIPVAAGLAGGSSDAAAVFRGLNQLLALGLTEEELSRLGVRIGADVPYCIRGGTMLAEGIGDILSPLPNPPGCYLLLAKPEIDVPTGWVYAHLRLDDSKTHPDVDGMINALLNQDLAKITYSLGNILESVTEPEHKIISVIKKEMLDGGAFGALMSGSGPTVFGIFGEKEDAEKTAVRIRERGYAKQIFVTEFTDGKENGGGVDGTGF